MDTIRKEIVLITENLTDPLTGEAIKGKEFNNLYGPLVGEAVGYTFDASMNVIPLTTPLTRVRIAVVVTDVTNRYFKVLTAFPMP